MPWPHAPASSSSSEPATGRTAPSPAAARTSPPTFLREFPTVLGGQPTQELPVSPDVYARSSRGNEVRAMRWSHFQDVLPVLTLGIGYGGTFLTERFRDRSAHRRARTAAIADF